MARTTGYRKAAALFAAVSVASLGLAACSSGGEEPAPESDATAEAPAEAVTIQYLHRLPDGEGMVPVAEIVDRWNAEHPEIQVEATKFDGASAEMIKKLETDVKANNAPCLAQIGYGEVPEVFSKGLVEDVAAEAEKYKDNYSGAYGQMQVGDAVVGLPQDTGPLVYFYDEAAFADLGIEVPTTVDELKEAAKAAAEQGKYILDFEPDEAQYMLSALSAAAGDTWYAAENDAWKVTTTGDGASLVADFWQEMIDSGAALTHERWGEAYANALASGELVGNIGPAWEAGFMLDGVVPEGEEGTWKVALLPEFGNGQMTGPDGGSGVAVMKGCEYPAEAMQFNDWFNTQTEDLATQGLVVAALGDVVTPEKVKMQFGGQDVFAELAKANETLNPNFGYIPGFSAVGAKMNEVAGNVVAGEGKVMDIFTAAQDESVKTLKDLNLPVAE
ncbi:MAG: extracellular solute-binding protein [Actinomycetaceae bacterium]|nr:extracellular solute-binding protein [Actinomycetaceae bacterium]